MIGKTKKKIFGVDDDAVYLELLKIEFADQPDYVLECFSTGELCIENLTAKPDIIILDYHLDGTEKSAMNGLQTLDFIKKHDPSIPVIMLSGQDKIEVAVNCMQHNAADYVVKSETAFVRLLKIIHAIFDKQKMENVVNWYKSNA